MKLNHTPEELVDMALLLAAEGKEFDVKIRMQANGFRVSYDAFNGYVGEHLVSWEDLKSDPAAVQAAVGRAIAGAVVNSSI